MSSFASPAPAGFSVATQLLYSARKRQAGQPAGCLTRIEATICRAQKLIAEDQQMCEATKSMCEILILVITLLANRLGLNSTNSIKPPLSDPYRKRRENSNTGRTGGQQGHVGVTLKKVDAPDKIAVIKIAQRTIAAGRYPGKSEWKPARFSISKFQAS